MTNTNLTESRPRSAPSPVVTEIGLNRSRSSLKTNEDAPPATAMEIPSLSGRLAHVHERLTQLDVPCSISCATWPDMIQLRSERREVWSLAERLIFGRSADEFFEKQKDSIEVSSADHLPLSSSDQNSASNEDFFHQLLTMRLISAPRSSSNQPDHRLPGMRSTLEVSLTDSGVHSSRVSRSDPELAREPPGAISDHLTASVSTSKQTSAECIHLSTEAPGIKKK